ncbi:MAG: helicase RepA family protein [Ethanoligenens sp.]
MQHEKTTAPVASVGADAGQSPKKNTTSSIPDIPSEIKRTSPADSSRLQTKTMSELYEAIYPSRPPLINGLLYPGTYLFVGAPKLGKSFLMAQIAFHISMGLPICEYPVRKSAVLYLALEDDYRRLQERLYRMFGTESADNLHFAISARQLANGLDEQLNKFVKAHLDTGLIIIDTLQKIREMGGESYSYANDYEIITRLKCFADHYGLCLLLVHHTRKQQADDKFDMISGTNGLLGAADGAFLLQKEERTSNDATLDISGRDQQDQRLHLKRDPEKLLWLFENAESELWEDPPDPILEAVAAIVTKAQPIWKGSPTDLVQKLGLDMKPNVLTLRLNVNAGRLYNDHGVRYESSRNHTGRYILLSLTAVRDDCDGRDDVCGTGGAI